MFRDARAAGTLSASPRRVLPDGCPDAGRAALRAVLGFAWCTSGFGTVSPPLPISIFALPSLNAS